MCCADRLLAIDALWLVVHPISLAAAGSVHNCKLDLCRGMIVK